MKIFNRVFFIVLCLVVLMTIIGSKERNRRYSWPKSELELKRYYTERITDTELDISDREEALGMFLFKFGSTEALPFALYLADYCDSKCACAYVGNCIDQIMKDVGFYSFQNKLPSKTVERIIIPYFELAVSLDDDHSARILANFYREGWLVSRDTTKAFLYDSLAQAIENKRELKIK